VRLVVNSTTGAVVYELAYDSFGNVLVEDDHMSNFQQPFGFAGGMYDPDTGLVRFGVRDYDPEVGRWTQKDPILLAGGVNLYEYAAGDPVNNIDPTGLIVETGWDIVNVGLSAGMLAQDIECGSAGDVALSGAGLAYDILAVAVPGLPAGAGALGKAAKASKQLHVRTGLKAGAAAAGVKFTPKMHSQSKVIAKGSSIDKIADIVSKFGGKAKEWTKKKTWTDGGQEIHYYQHSSGRKVGIKLAGDPDPF
jgi:RHS repeat-associated protein